ncbi:MAG: hypothetical protein JXA57_11230 [Armatimonadetes bacterium]|nr:hypothetical protein [Armatimonadota bacterium]
MQDTSPLEQEIRALLDARLGLPLSDEDYRFLLLEGHVSDIGAEAPDSPKREALLKKAILTVRNLRASQGRPVGKDSAKASEMATDDRHRRYALSCLLAREAAVLPEVVEFRRKYLGGEVLAWKDMEDWILRQAEADSGYSQYIEVVIPEDTVVRPTLSGLVVESPVPLAELRTEGGVRARFLEYGVEGGTWVESVPVRSGGVLDELRKLSDRLARSYSWKTDQATVFVLTGVIPLMVGIRLETEVQSEHPAASRVTLIIDPVVSPQEVFEAYGQVRERMMEGTARPLTEKHLKLAVFAAERRPPAKWAEVMEAWNREYPDWRYEKETLFARDATAAQNRILRPRLDADGLL